MKLAKMVEIILFYLSKANALKTLGLTSLAGFVFYIIIISYDFICQPNPRNIVMVCKIILIQFIFH